MAKAFYAFFLLIKVKQFLKVMFGCNQNLLNLGAELFFLQLLLLH